LETSVNPSDIAVATITRVRGLDDERAVKQSLATLVATGIPVAASDGGSPKRFVDWLRRLPNLTLAKRGDTLVRQVRASLVEAHQTGRPFILYTEADKRDFFAGGLAEFIARASIAGSIGIQLAARSESAFTTFPPYQRLAEASASELCRRTIGANTDYFYGPFLVRRELARLVFSASDDLGWGWRPFLFVAASRLGHRIVGIRGDYNCPHDQRREQDRDKEHRLRQFTDNVRGLLDGVMEKGCAVGTRV
jgi:hypothetical protein